MISSISIPSLVLFLSLAASSMSAPIAGEPDFCPCEIIDGVLVSLGLLHPPHPDPPHCNNGGLAYAVQNSPFTKPDASFIVGSFHSIAPAKTGQTDQTGFTTKLGFVNQHPSTPYSINGGPPMLTDRIAVNYRGYFTAPTSGEYTLSWEKFDDIAFFWLGAPAFNGAYTNANALSSIVFGAAPKQYKFTLVGGSVSPMRFLAANTGGPTDFAASLIAPDGTTVLISKDSTANMPWFTQFSCDRIMYPPFQNFGKET